MIKNIHSIRYSLFFLGLAFLLYGNTIPNFYAIDDPIVTNNELVQRGIKGIPEIFASRYRITEEYNYGYRPIVKSTFAIEYEFFGQNPHVSHFINVLLYGVLLAFLFTLLSKLFIKYNKILPLLITIIFACHPIHTEAVASLKNREELLGFLGCIISLYLFIKYIETYKWKYAALGILAYTFAFFSKQNALTFLAVIPLTLYFFSDVSVSFIAEGIRNFSDKYLGVAGRYISEISHYAAGGFKFMIGNLAMFGAASCYFIAAWKGSQVLYEFTIILLVIQFYMVDTSRREKFIGSFRSVYLLLAIMALVGYGLSVILRSQGIIAQPYLSMILAVVFILLIGSHFYFKTPHIISQLIKALKSPYIIISILCLWLAIKVGSFNFYYMWVLILYTISILGVIAYLLKQGTLITIYHTYVRVVDSNKQTRIPSPPVVIPLRAKFVVLAATLLAIASILAINGPNQYLPEEIRELKVYENPLFYESDIWMTLATGFYSLLIYLKLLFYPHPLVFYYGFNHVPVVDITNMWVVLSMTIHLALLIYALAFIKRKSIISYAILYYLATISIFANMALPIPGIIGERLLFMPSLGFSMVIGYLIFRMGLGKQDPLQIGIKVKKRVLLLALVLLIPYSAKTISRNLDWKDHLTLYLHDIPYLENSLHANSLVASHLLRDINPNPVTATEKTESERKLKKVIHHFNRVLELDPNEARTLNNLGTIYYDFYEAYEKAIPYFEKAIANNPAFSQALFNKAFCHERLGQIDEAVAAYEEVLNIKPEDMRATSNLANLLFSRGEFERAINLNSDLATIDPTSPIPYLNIAGYYLKKGDEPKAVEYFEKSLEVSPSDVDMALKLSAYFNENGNAEKAQYYSKLAGEITERNEQLIK